MKNIYQHVGYDPSKKHMSYKKFGCEDVNCYGISATCFCNVDESFKTYILVTIIDPGGNETFRRFRFNNDN